ncbi:DUF6602 domain-containing protein [Tumebacillus permanentifrigoris]|uniref:Uncharacterized protein n=1 Tax=Tumebacillus permanentifrigoris TaxID=378543 RepID=A0A316D4N9_9BACL|nr:DUF6602 domain-containing protein [Tumebacillus permanentifrigoris]PWK05032.1 hypothetical protein C7459_1283 [Tumebacillus permanentifrigoris]
MRESGVVVWEAYFKGVRREERRLLSGQGTLGQLLTHYFEQTIQRRYAVTSGYVYAVDGSHNERCSDLILFNRLHTPKMRSGVVPLIPAETTGAVIQTIDCLTERILIEEAHHLQQVRALPKLTPKSNTRGLALVSDHPYTMGVLVCAASELSLSEIHNLLVEQQRDVPLTERVSAVFVLGVGVVLYTDPTTQEARYFPLEDSSLTILERKEDSLAYLMLYVCSYLNSIDFIPPNFLKLLSTEHIPAE